MQQHLPPALQFALVILFHLLTRLIFRLYLPGKLFHLALALALNVEKRAATRYARSLIAAHLDAKLLLNASMPLAFAFVRYAIDLCVA